MKVFNKDKALRQIKLKQNKNTYIKKVSIVLSCFILLVGIIMFTFAKFEQNSEEYTLINGVVKYGGSGDIQLSYVVDGVSQSTPPAKGTGYKIKNVDCTNADGTWMKDKWGLEVVNITGKAKCNLEFETQTSVEVTLNSAPLDELYYYDGTNKVIIGKTDSTGKLENAMLNPEEITIYSSVAKNPNDLSNDYSKTVTISNETKDIYIMPVTGDKLIYWYGYMGNISFYDNHSNSSPSVTYYTNYFLLSIASGHLQGIVNQAPIQSSSVHAIMKNISNIPYSHSINILLNSNKEPAWTNDDYARGSYFPTTNTLKHIYYDLTSGTYGMLLSYGYSAYDLNIYGMWLD